MIVRLLFARISMNWPKRQHGEKPSFPVNCVERFVNMGQLLFAFFWVFLSGRLLLGLPFVMARQDWGLVIGDLVDGG